MLDSNDPLVALADTITGESLMIPLKNSIAIMVDQPNLFV
jgi:hypothetical protein